MATKAKRHVHKYHKVDLGYSVVWACALPDCNHYMPKHMEKTVEGKYSYCWGCGEKFLMSATVMDRDKPICLTCRGLIPVANEPEPMSEKLKELLDRLENPSHEA